MKKIGLLLLLTFTPIWLVGCGTDNAADEQNQKVEEKLNPGNDNPASDMNDDNKLGYVSYKKDNIQTEVEDSKSVTINRTKLANMITRIILQNDGIAEAATLVTDEEVIVAYSKDEDINSDTAAAIARKSTTAVMPRQFDVYVSEDESLMQDIQGLHKSSVEEETNNHTINRIINEIKSSSQKIDD